MEEEFIIRNGEIGDATLIAAFLRKMIIEEMKSSGGYPASTIESEWDHFNEVIRNNLDAEDFRYKIAEIPDNNHKMVGVIEARIISPAFIYQPSRILHIHSLYVEVANREKGIGRSLLEAIIEWGREQKCEEVELDVLVNNSAQAFYYRLGFHPFEYKMVRKL